MKTHCIRIALLFSAICLLPVWAFAQVTQYTVTAVAGPNGSVAPASQVVVQGGFVTITVTPDPGYVVAGISNTTCSAYDNGDGTWTSSSIVGDCELDVSFSLPPQYTVTAVAGPNGSATPSSQVVVQAATATITITPDPGYVIAGVDGGACGAFDNGDGTWTTDGIYGDCEVDASFVLSATDVVYQGDFDSDIVAVDNLNLGIDQTILGSSINWLTGAVCHSCGDTFYHFRAATSFAFLGHFYLVFRFPINMPDNSYGVVTDVAGDNGNSTPLASGAVVGPNAFFGFPVSIPSTAAWRSTAGVDAYLGFRFLNPNTGRINYGYARLVTATSTMSSPSGIPATIVSYAYDRRGNAITIP
jgi:hypothetical protein